MAARSGRHEPGAEEEAMNETSEVHPPAYHLVMCSFDGTDAAARALDRLRSAGTLTDCEIEGEALVSRSASGKIHWKEKGSTGIGAAVGATAMGIVGLVGGPVILPIMVVVGAVAGGVAGHFAGLVLSPDDLREVAGSCPLDSSAYLGLVDTAHAAAVGEAFAAEGARVLDLPIRTDLSNAIHETAAARAGRS